MVFFCASRYHSVVSQIPLPNYLIIKPNKHLFRPARKQFVYFATQFWCVLERDHGISNTISTRICQTESPSVFWALIIALYILCCIRIYRTIVLLLTTRFGNVLQISKFCDTLFVNWAIFIGEIGVETSVKNQRYGQDNMPIVS